MRERERKDRKKGWKKKKGGRWKNERKMKERRKEGEIGRKIKRKKK